MPSENLIRTEIVVIFDLLQAESTALTRKIAKLPAYDLVTEDMLRDRLTNVKSAIKVLSIQYAEIKEASARRSEKNTPNVKPTK